MEFFNGITTGGTQLIATDGGVVHTTNGTAASPTFAAFRRGTLSQYVRHWEEREQAMG